MADKLVRTHTNQSNRARAKDALEKKIVFRSVLDNPFRVQWPSVPVNIQNVVLARFIDMLHGVPEYRLAQEQTILRKKRQMKFARNAASRAKKRPRWAPFLPRAHAIVPDSVPMGEPQTDYDTVASDGNDAEDLRPEIMDHITAGINAVTRLLENTARSMNRTTVSTASTETSPTGARPSIILVCRGDVSPPALIQHIPHLVAACNTRGVGTNSDAVHLIPLPKGAEASLAAAIGLRRVAVVAVHADALRLPELSSLIEHVPPPTASWLAAPTAPSISLIPTHIKQLRTTAPKDMKAAKEHRMRCRAAAKVREQAKRRTEKIKRVEKVIAA